MLCEHCGTEFDPHKNSNAKRVKYCSKQCRQAAHNKLKPVYPGLSTGKVGAIGELRVSADLLARGYDVYRAVSQASDCDLVAIKDSVTLRIEVRTGQVNPNGSIAYRKSTRDCGKSDHYTVVLTDQIIYVPCLEVKQ
jgi:hypothetical protein